MDHVGYILLGIAALIFVIWRRSKRKTRVNSTSKKTNKNGEDALSSVVKTAQQLWKSDFRTVFYTFVLLLILNLMLKYMTSTIPEIWDWYYTTNNHLFFVFFNIGWIAFAFFSSKRDDKDKPIPDAQGRAKAILWAIGIFTLINIGGLVKTKFTTGNNSAGRGQVEAPMDVVLEAIAEVESGNRQFDENGKLIRNTVGPNDPQGRREEDSVGRYQINIGDPAIKKLMDDNNLDPTKEPDNRKAAELLYGMYGTNPWKGSRDRLGLKLIAKGYSPDGKGSIRQANLPLDLGVVKVPKNDWSEERKAPQLNGTILSWGRIDTSKGKECEVKFDRDSKKVFPIIGNYRDFRPTIIQFRCPEPDIEVRVTIERSL